MSMRSLIYIKITNSDCATTKSVHTKSNWLFLYIVALNALSNTYENLERLFLYIIPLLSVYPVFKYDWLDTLILLFPLYSALGIFS